ncbi:MAG: hypothetical protein EGS40_13490 [Agathobacter sp.]|nr:hypothetical protein [Agathobacter sp.]MBD9288218.1 hypothetical protein [Agathobacter sp.]
MKNAPDKLQWHPAFCAAAGLEFHEDIERLELKPEYNLSKEPIRIDLLIIYDRTFTVSSADYCDTGIRAGRTSEFVNSVKSCKERRCRRIPEERGRNEYTA